MDPIWALWMQTPMGQVAYLMLALLIAIAVMLLILCVMSDTRNKLLRSIDQSLKALPSVRNQRRSA